MIIEIRATFQCDECGKQFSVAMDQARNVFIGESLFDEAEDALRGSLNYIGPTTRKGLGGCSSIQNNKHCCGYCTEIKDSK